MTQSRTETLILMLMAIVILLIVAIAGLFFRMTQLQGEVLAALEPFQVMRGPEGLETGIQAPAFTLTNTEGQKISLTDLVAQRILLSFSSTHCPACAEMYPHLETLSEDRQDISVVMVSHGTAEENRRLVEEQDFEFLVLTWEDAVANEYQVPGTPFFYVIDGQGVIVNKGFASSLEQLEALVDDSGE
jgi:methylamine dehydrogenase accessory protein MauD